MAGIKNYIALLFIAFGPVVNAQIVTEGRIIFERKTNLVKRFDDPRMEEMLRGQKVKIENFELIFNDSSCVFQFIPTDEVDQLSWATTRNTVYQNLNSEQRLSILDLWGNKVHVLDTIEKREWKITDSKRNLAGYECIKSVWEKDDSTRIYAWFAPEIAPSVGPEMFNGLPGAILGLATEDGGIIYFAKEVEVKKVDATKLAYDLSKEKTFTVEELREDLKKRFGKQPWAERALRELFRWF